MHITVTSDEIVKAVTSLVEGAVMNATVVEVVFVREKGGKVRAEVAVELR